MNSLTLARREGLVKKNDETSWVQGGPKKADSETYEEKKLKMRKAMGENLHDAAKEADPDAEQRRLNIMK